MDKFKVGDWAAQNSCFGKQFGKVKSVYPDGSIDVVIYDLDGTRLGRTSPAMGGPKHFEPYCAADGWIKVEDGEPDFPVDSWGFDDNYINVH